MNTQTIRLQLFGGPRLVGEERSISLSPLQGALVGVLGEAGPEGVSRDRIIQLLWEENPGTRTRHRLSQLLYALSKKTAPLELIDATDERVRLDPEIVDSDLAPLRSTDSEALDTVASLTGREFLSGLSRLPTRAYEEWRQRTRARLRSDLRERAARTWARSSEEARWEEAVQAAVVLLELDPTNEEALRRLMRARGMAGQVDEAFAAFTGYRERWMSEPDREPWEPAPETRTLLARLRTLEKEPQPPPEIRGDPAPPDPPFCGRREEVARISRVLANREARNLTTVCVTGEGGIGKTRLVEEAVREARLRGYLVLRGGTTPFEQDIPLNLLLDALDRDEVGGALNGLDDPWRSVLLSLMPHFHRGEGALPEVPTIKPDNIPRRMYQAVHRLMEAIGERTPLVVFLDDFQWADETSVTALEFLRRRWSGGRMILVLGLRHERIGPRSPALEFAEEVLGEEDTISISLRELDPDAADRLVQEASSRPLDAGVRQRICALGGMNPFFLVELTHEYLNGRLTPWLRGPGERLAVPVSVRQVLERRFIELADDDVHLLEVLTVHDRPLPWSSLPEIAGLPAPRCVECIERLQAVRLARWQDHGLATRHELIRHTVYARMSEPRRVFLHERIARSLLSSDGAEHPDELALHFDRAGIRDEALRFSQEAADRAETSGAVPEAIHFLTMARRNTDDPETAATIVGRLGHLNYLHRNLQDAAPLLELAATRFREQGRMDRALTAEVERIDALSRMESLPLEDFLEEVARIKAEARGQEEWETLARALDVEAHALDRKGDVEGVRRVLDEVEKIADRGSAVARCAARTVLAIDAYYRDPQNALKSAEEAVTLAQATSQQDRILTATNRLLVVQIVQGRFKLDDGQQLADAAKDIAKTSSDLFQRFNLPANLGFWYSEEGRYGLARQLYGEAKKVIQNTNAHLARFTLEMNLGELELLARRFPEAIEHHSNAENVPQVGLPYYAIDLLAAGRGLCELELGQLTSARKHLHNLRKFSNEWVFDPFIIILFRTRMKERLGTPHSALAYLHSQLPLISERFITAWIKLKLEEARLFKKTDQAKMRTAATEGLKVATQLRMSMRVAEFEKYLEA